MRITQKRLDFDVLEGVTITIQSRAVTITGPRGKVSLSFKHIPVDIYFLEGSDERKIVVERWFTAGKATAALRTVVSHICNAQTGVTKGFLYKMRFVYSHFPINVAITNAATRVEIRNFLGEKVIRVVECLKGARHRLARRGGLWRPGPLTRVQPNTAGALAVDGSSAAVRRNAG